MHFFVFLLWQRCCGDVALRGYAPTAGCVRFAQVTAALPPLLTLCAFITLFKYLILTDKTVSCSLSKTPHTALSTSLPSLCDAYMLWFAFQPYSSTLGFRIAVPCAPYPSCGKSRSAHSPHTNKQPFPPEPAKRTPFIRNCWNTEKTILGGN